MKQWHVSIVFVVFALLTGCATMGKVSGFIPQARESFDAQEPWHNLVLEGHISEITEVAVSYIPLPSPIPERLDREIFYSRPAPNPKVATREGENKTNLQRWSLRALVYRGEYFVGMYDVFVDFPHKVFIPFFPLNGSSSEYRYKGDDLNFLILSSNGLWVLTTYGKIVDLPKGVSLLELPSGFFREHPSRMPSIVTVKRSDPDGRKWFENIASVENGFSREFEWHGKKYSGRGNTEYVHDTFTATSYVVDRLISCGVGTASLAMVNPIGLAIAGGPQVIHNVRVIAKENCDLDD